jgi:hypothetical protein
LALVIALVFRGIYRRTPAPKLFVGLFVYLNINHRLALSAGLGGESMFGLYLIAILFRRVIMMAMKTQPTSPTTEAASPVRRLLLAEFCLVKGSGLKKNLELPQPAVRPSSLPAFLQKILMSTGYRRGGINVRLPEPRSPDSFSTKLETPHVVFRISPDTTADMQQ